MLMINNGNGGLPGGPEWRETVRIWVRRMERNGENMGTGMERNAGESITRNGVKLRIWAQPFLEIVIL